MQKKKVWKRISAAILTTVLALTMPAGAFAAEEYNFAVLRQDSGSGEDISSESPQDPSQQKALSDCQITLDKSTYTYNGKAQTPSVTVTDGETKLTSGTDYTVTYESNINAGTAQAIITGNGNYTGSVTQTFTIKKAGQKISYTKSYKKAYGSKAFTVKAKRTTGKGKLSYASSDKKVVTVNGKGKVTIKGTGAAVITVKAAETANYSAKSVKITVKVSPKKQTLYSVKTVKKPTMTVTWKKDSRATGYQIQYSTAKNFKKVKTVTVQSNRTTKKTVKNLTRGKRYYVRVRSYKTAKVNGKSTRLYGAWSSAKSVKIARQKKAYTAYYNYMKKSELSDYTEFQLIKLDGDSTPELIGHYRDEYYMDNYVICSYDGKKVVTEFLFDGISTTSYYRGVLYYLPKKGKIWDTSQYAGGTSQYDDIYTLKGGKLKRTAHGEKEYSEKASKFKCKWNNKSMSESTYEKKLNKAFDTSKAKAFRDMKFISKAKMKAKLQ